MQQPASPRTRLLALAATALLCACGSARDVADGQPLCQRCHGGESGNAAPPRSVGGASATTEVAVGAHQAHLVAGRLRGPIACAECHVVPADMAGHEAEIARIAAGTASRVTFGPLADRGAGTAAWDPATATCSATYCHGANLNHGGSLQVPTWTVVDAGHSQAACGTCHGYPPDPATTPHPDVSAVAAGCSACHSRTVEDDDVTIKVAADGTSTHIDGGLTIDDVGGACTYCHGFPPSDAAHAVHTHAAVAAYGDLRQADDVFAADSARYAFGCGHCHPLDFAEHGRHFSESAGVFVTLTPDAGTEGSLRALASATAAYDPADTTCSGVYCHSTGQELPAFVATPGWSSGATLGCDGCHANPPRYATGGAGAATANSHVGLLEESDGKTYETGHFGGFPAMAHDGSQHGAVAEASSPITCQTCHWNTTDPAHTGPSGFYYLDTSGRFDLGGTGDFCFGGSGSTCVGGTVAPAYACAQCHDGTPPSQGGAVRPYFHANGARDVAFDPRTSITGTPTLPPAPDTPTRPYWFTGAPAWVGTAVGASGGMEGTTASFHLASATWDPATKTCGSVACHFNAANRPPIRWGEPLLYAGVPDGTCGICHDN